MNSKNQNTPENTECGSWHDVCWSLHDAANRPDKYSDDSFSGVYGSQYVRVDHGKNDSASGYDSEFFDENHEKEIPIGSPNPGGGEARPEATFPNESPAKSPTSPNSARQISASRPQVSQCVESSSAASPNPAPNENPEAISTDASRKKRVFELKKENFYPFIESSEKIMIDFWAPRNLASQNQTKILESLLRGQDFDASARFARVNVEENPELAEAFGIDGAPTTLLFRNGRAARRFVGLTDALVLFNAMTEDPIIEDVALERVTIKDATLENATSEEPRQEKDGGEEAENGKKQLKTAENSIAEDEKKEEKDGSV